MIKNPVIFYTKGSERLPTKEDGLLLVKMARKDGRLMCFLGTYARCLPCSVGKQGDLHIFECNGFDTGVYLHELEYLIVNDIGSV
ncbi:hypothetical protein [Neisseria sp. Ec49-e6-T10]|uniref:hypothetical protein n=1 Tax=Neisseria sp. Ec49-e6-T10 TaxID=3140744 RepID=UPI003EB90CF6